MKPTDGPGNENYKGDKKLIAYQLADLNEAIGKLEDEVGSMKVDIVEKIGEVKIEVARRAGLVGGLSGLASSIVVMVASLVAIFKKG